MADGRKAKKKKKLPRKYILSLKTEFKTQFTDFNSFEENFSLYSSIFSKNIESVPNHMKMEVIKIY